MEFVLADLLFHLTGRIVLFLRYRNRNKVRRVLQEEYNNSYTDAGRMMMLQSVAFLFLLLIFAMFAVFLAVAVKDIFRNG